MATTIPTGFPTADNTGVPSGTTLTAYTGPMTITTAGTVIEDKIINGGLDITGANVTIRNCIITYNDFFGIDDYGNGVNLTVENCTIIGPGYNGDSPAAISCDVGGGTFVGNDISGAEHGIALGPGSGVVKDNYIHDGGSNKADPHIGGISLKGGQDNVLIEGNTVILGSDATSDIFLQNNFGPISNVTINHNYLAGDPGYDLYVEGRLNGGPVTNVSITNNVIVDGHYGDYSIVDADPTFSNNFTYPPGTTVTTDPTGGTQPPTSGSVSINDISISEGNSGTKVATFTVTRSGGTAAFDVNYATSDGTATVADSDYVAAHLARCISRPTRTRRRSRSRLTATPRLRGMRPSTSICRKRQMVAPSVMALALARSPTMTLHRLHHLQVRRLSARLAMTCLLARLATIRSVA